MNLRKRLGRWLFKRRRNRKMSALGDRLTRVERIAHVLEDLGHSDLADELRDREDRLAVEQADTILEQND